MKLGTSNTNSRIGSSFARVVWSGVVDTDAPTIAFSTLDATGATPAPVIDLIIV